MSRSAAENLTLTSANRDASLLAVSRAIAELRQGREIDLTGARRPATLAALAAVWPDDLPALADPSGGYTLLLTSARAGFLGLGAPEGGVIVRLPAGTDAETLRQLAGLSSAPWPGGPLQSEPADGDWVQAAFALAIQARLAPALLIDVAAGALSPAERLGVAVDDTRGSMAARGRALVRLSSARVPLTAHPDCEFIVWRERFGDFEHLAIVVGRPDLSGPVLVRVHSSCLTGDLFASLRCDCGEQLQGAIARMARQGGGVLLYLSQEGRGIGLVNKLRAYQLQDQAHDTIDADRYLGFSSDERDYTVAGTMLEALGIGKVRLLTNNPLKIKALAGAGIDVVERVAINIPSNAVNERYIRTKHERAGHLGPDALTDRAGRR